jgi:hypothetical protein
MPYRSSTIAAAVCAAALALLGGGANANVVRVAPGAPQAPAARFAGWHYQNGVLFATPHYMPTVRAARVRPDSGLLVWGGGYVQHPPRILLTFWGWHNVDPSGERAYLRKFVAGIGGSAYLSVVTQYYDSTGHITNPAHQLAGVWHDPAAIPSSPSDSDIANEALRTASHFSIVDQNTSYVIATPSGHSTPGFGSSFCAYHGKVSDGAVLLAYTNLPYMTDAGGSCGENFVNPGPSGVLDGVSIVEGHELAETQTDPDYFTGWNSSSGEIGDLCAWQNLGNTHLTTGNFAVQPLYSDAVSGCVRN